VCFAEGSSVEEHLCWPATASKRGVKVRSGITGEPWGNVGGKGVSWLVGYFMGYYTIWLAAVKRIFVPFWEIAQKNESTCIRIFAPAGCHESVIARAASAYVIEIGKYSNPALTLV